VSRGAGRTGEPPPLPEALPVAVLDSHAHLDLMGVDVDEALAAAASVGIGTVVQVGVDLPSSRWSVEVAAQHAQVHAARARVAQQPLLAAERDLAVGAVDGDAQVSARRDADAAVEVDHLDRPGRASLARGRGRKDLIGSHQLEAPGLAHLLKLRLERVVDLPAQLGAQRDVGDERDEHDRDPDRTGGEQRQAVAQRHHGSRRT